MKKNALSFCLIVFLKSSVFAQESPLVFPIKEFDIHTIIDFLDKQRKNFDGFKKGVLVKAVDGYIPIEKIFLGDCLAGEKGDQSVLGLYSRNIDGEMYYGISTEEHSFYVYPDELVHNMDIATVTASGSFLLGVVEFLNPAVFLSAALVPMALYAVNNYAKKHSEQSLIAHKILTDSQVILDTRDYYVARRDELVRLREQLLRLKNELQIFLANNNASASLFLSIICSPWQNFLEKSVLLPTVAVEMNLSVAEKETLFLLRDQELNNLKSEIFDIEIALGFHVNEMIERRDLAIKKMANFQDQIEKGVNIWNSNVHFLTGDIALSSYQSILRWYEFLNNIDLKIKEMQPVINFYMANKNHLFVSKATNLLALLELQIAINNEIARRLKESRAVCMRNLEISEAFLNKHKLLNHVSFKVYLAQAQEFVTAGEQSSQMYFEKKKNSMNGAKTDFLKKGSRSCNEDPDPDDDDDEKFKKKHPNGKYESNPKHHKNSVGDVSKPPVNGQAALDKSILVKLGKRVAVEGKNFIVFMEHETGKFHGFVVENFHKLRVDVQKILVESGIVENIKSGKIKK